MRYQANGAKPRSETKSSTPPDHEQRGEKRGDEAHRDHGDVVAAHDRPVLVSVVHGRGQHRRHRQEERELRRGAAVDPEQEAAHDRSTRPRDAGDHGHGLAKADLQRGRRRDPLDPMVARIRMDALDQEDGKAAQDQRGHHHPGAEQHGLDEAVGKSSDHHRRDEAEENVAREADLVRVAQQSARDAKEAMAIGPADGEDRAELDHHLEHLAGRPAKADQVDHEDQMAGRGDRDELGQTLDDPEEKRPEQEFQIHCASLLAAGCGGSRGPQPCRHQLLRADRSPRVNPLGSIGGQAERSLPWRQSVTESFRIELRCRWSQNDTICPGGRAQNPA